MRRSGNEGYAVSGVIAQTTLIHGMGFGGHGLLDPVQVLVVDLVDFLTALFAPVLSESIRSFELVKAELQLAQATRLELVKRPHLVLELRVDDVFEGVASLDEMIPGEAHGARKKLGERRYICGVLPIGECPMAQTGALDQSLERVQLDFPFVAEGDRDPFVDKGMALLVRHQAGEDERHLVAPKDRARRREWALQRARTRPARGRSASRPRG